MGGEEGGDGLEVMLSMWSQINLSSYTGDSSSVLVLKSLVCNCGVQYWSFCTATGIEENFYIVKMLKFQKSTVAGASCFVDTLVNVNVMHAVQQFPLLFSFWLFLPSQLMSSSKLWDAWQSH